MLDFLLQNELRDARSILIAGAGGGYDFLCGLPLFWEIERTGRRAHLANLSFTKLQETSRATSHTPHLWEINAHSQGGAYFPEKWLACWLWERFQKNVSLWCFSATGLVPYTQSYHYLIKHLNVDAILLVDGGIDSLLRGDESSLGTPLWDALSVGAVSAQNVTTKILATTAMSAERWDKISHAQVLNRIADLTSTHALKGVSSLVPQSEIASLFTEAAHYIFQKQPDVRPSTIVSAMLASLRGEFGERAINTYTQNTPLWISPLLNLYWFFDLDEVASQKLFLPALQNTQTVSEAADQLRQWTEKQTPAAWETIPI